MAIHECLCHALRSSVGDAPGAPSEQIPRDRYGATRRPVSSDADAPILRRNLLVVSWPSGRHGPAQIDERAGSISQHSLAKRPSRTLAGEREYVAPWVDVADVVRRRVRSRRRGCRGERDGQQVAAVGILQPDQRVGVAS